MNEDASNVPPDDHIIHEPRRSPSNWRLMICAAGILICYSCYAVLLEKITRVNYVDDDSVEKFTYMFALVFVQFVVNCIFAKLLLVTVMKQGEDNTKTAYYACAALMYLLAMVSTNMALRYVNFPTQVIAKAAKPIPIVVLGILLNGKTYPLKKYSFIALIIGGVILFTYRDDIPVKTIDGETLGQVLLLFSLTMDGLLGVIQHKMCDEHETKSGHMMLNMNAWSILFGGIVIVCTGELLDFFKFLQRHPSAIWHIVGLSACGALGQYFIFMTVSKFGPLTCSVITTTRKCFTVVISVVYFGNALLPRQWIAAFLVFFGLFLDMFYGK